jgi:serine/threonine kinase PknH
MWGRKGSSSTAPAPAEKAPEPPKSPFKAFLTSPVLASMLIALVIAGSVAGVLAATQPSDNAATNESPATTTAATTTATTSPPSGPSRCGGRLSVGPNTSCRFAHNVEDAYHANGGPGTFQVYSPVTGQTYTMTCNLSRRQVVCTGGDNASLYFPK